MNSNLNVRQRVGASVSRNRAATSMIVSRGVFVVEHLRDGKVIRRETFPNGVTDEGKNKILDVMFGPNQAATQPGEQFGTWYIGMIDNAGFTALAAGDIYDDIDQAGNGWDEFTTYTDANNGDSAVTRPTWQTNDAASQAIANTTQAVFDITTAGTVKGVFIVAGDEALTKADHTLGNTLWATALFSGGDIAVAATDSIRVIYSVSN